MNLIDENEEVVQDEKKKKVVKYIIIVIAVLIALAIILIVANIISNKNKIKFYVDSKSQSFSSELFYMADKKNLYTNDKGEIYVSVEGLCSVLGSEYSNDEYKVKGEDKSKCYIKNKDDSTIVNEYTSFNTNSNEIYKAVILDDYDINNIVEDTTTSSSKKVEETKSYTEYEYFTLDEGSVIMGSNNKIYASMSAIKIGFNVSISYNASSKTITINKLSTLESAAAKQSSSVVTGSDCDYYNKRMLKYGLALVKNSDNNYGIIDYFNYQANNYVISCKYSKLRFCESTGTVIATNADDSKQGIYKIDLTNRGSATLVVNPSYQLIKKIDEKQNLYVIEDNSKYGMIKLEDNLQSSVLSTEYQQIGLDYAYQGMDNQYLIEDEYIPVKKNDKWGVTTVEKRDSLLIPCNYDGIGCDQEENGSGVVIIPDLINGDTDVIVFSNIVQLSTDVQSNSSTKAETKTTYCLINTKTGAKLHNLDVASVYKEYSNNSLQYMMEVESASGNKTKLSITNLYGKPSSNSSNSSTNNSNTNTTDSNTNNGTSSNTTTDTNTDNSANTNTNSNNSAITNVTITDSNSNTSSSTSNSNNNTTTNNGSSTSSN